MSKAILIVDDVQENRNMLRSLLEGSGYGVVEASDGSQALLRAREALPTAIVTDLMMPGMDGFELCRAWMRDDLLRAVPFIVYTATYTDEKDRQLALDMGAAAYIVKPTEPDVLLQVLETVLAERAHARPDLENGEFFERYARRLHAKLDKKLEELAAREKQLVDYVTRCEAILDASPLAIVSVDPELRVRTWNYAAELLFGYTESEVVGRTMNLLVPRDHTGELQTRLAEATAGKQIVRFETRRLHKDGKLLDVEVSLRFIGPEIGFVGVVSSLAHRHEAARERATLEQQLNIAQRMESVGRLAGGVAHDFNNLLTVILSHASFIESSLKPGAHLHEDAVRIREAGERAASLTRQLLAFSRRQTVRLEVLDIRQTIREMEKMLRRLIGEDVELTVNLGPDLGKVEADASQLEQVLMNLAVNARDAMADGGMLTIDARNVGIDRSGAEARPPLRPGRYVCLSVSDNGCGMDEETSARAFDPFFTTKELGKGTGLGLATVYGIVQQNGGFVWMNSRIGEGTTVEVYLPRSDKALTPRFSNAPKAEARGHGEHIVFVEDDPMVRRLATRVLERAGFRVAAADGPKEALDLASNQDQPMDAMVTDVVLPGMNGRELAKRVLAIRPGLKVLFTSGYTNDAIARHGVLNEGVTLLAKPFTASQLASSVRSVLDGETPGGIGE